MSELRRRIESDLRWSRAKAGTEPAQALLAELRPKEDAVSMFEMEPAPDEFLQRFVAATALTRRSIDQQKVALFAPAEILARDMQVLSTPGTTADRTLNERHRDIHPVTASTVDGLAAAYLPSGLHVFPPGKVAAAVDQCVQKAWISLDEVDPALWRKVQTKLAETAKQDKQAG